MVAGAMFDPDTEAAFAKAYPGEPAPYLISPRRMNVLIRRMPAGAWPDPQHPASWSTEAHLTASVIDAVNQLTWVTVAANSKTKPKRPDPVHRPQPPRPQKKVSWSEAAALIAQGVDP